MWVYVNGIPKGDALGKRAQTAMQQAGLPSLRGLAPGILEDAQAALNPAPIVDAVFGTGYVKCKSVKLPVGDAQGRIKGRDGKEWIRALYPGDIQYDGSTPTQTRWVLDRQIRQEEFDAEEKVFCPDGSQKKSHPEGDCAKPMTAGFVGDMRPATAETTVPVVLVLFTLTALYLRFRS
jgi:hypothetical protein